MTPPSSLTLIHKQPLGGNIWSFTFEPNDPLNWKAGQAIRVELPHEQPDAAGAKRHFTITSAPHERVITITTRNSTSSFKRALVALPIGGRLRLLDQPAGTFSWPADERPVVLVAQGIGVTPFISILRQRRHDGLPLDAVLVQANLTPPAPFQDELRHLSADHPELKISYETSSITAQRLLALVPNLANTEVLVAGPRPLFELFTPPINLPTQHHQFDQFTGYAATHY